MPKPRLTPEMEAAYKAAAHRSVGHCLASLGLGRQSKAKPAKSDRKILGVGQPGPWRIVIEGWHPEGTVNNLLGKKIGHVTGIKRQDAKQLAAVCLEAGVSRATTKRRLRVTLYYPPGHCHHDADNPSKSIRDGLVTIGALVDDAGEWLDSEEAKRETGDKATVLELEDC